MDLNIAVVCGTIAAPPELRQLDSGARNLRYLITARSDAHPRRVDVLPVTYWDPPAELIMDPGVPGTPIWVVASVQRRFRRSDDGRRSRIELVARSVEVGNPAGIGPAGSSG